MVRPGGRIALLEVAEPPNPVLRWGHGVYFGKVVPRIGGLLSDPAAYRYLPKSVAYLPEPDERCWPWCATPGSPTPPATLFSGGISQLLLGTRDRDHDQSQDRRERAVDAAEPASVTRAAAPRMSS